MTIIQVIRYESSNGIVGVATDRAKPDNIWIEMAWTVLEAANDLDDEVTVEACQRIINDDLNGDLPAQSDMNTIFGFLDAHTH
jgi:hypothetical protein